MSPNVFQVLADDRRREILRLIQDNELSAGEIASQFAVTQPAISQHLRILINAQLVTVRKQGTRRLYRARPEGLAHVREFLENFWTDTLEELRTAAESEQKGLFHHGSN